jgi:hypothetical protein
MLTTSRNTALLVGLAMCALSGCDHPGASPTAPSLATSAFLMSGMQGTGGMGGGTPTYYGYDRQWFDIDVGTSNGLPYGTMEYIDSGFVKSDGHYPDFVVGPSWPGTAITGFVQTSSACAQFQGMGYLKNTGEQLAFDAMACDHGTPGVGVDTFEIQVPQRLITNGGVYRAGPLPLVYGDLTASGTATPAAPIP